MDKFIVKKSGSLKGFINIHSAKNAVLPIMAASVLTSGKCTLDKIPEISDVMIMGEILRDFGFELSFNGNTLNIECKSLKKVQGSYELMAAIRASFLMAGPLLAKYGKCVIPLPGGCSIGSRPVDLHLKGFSMLGADVNIEHGYVCLSGKHLVGNRVYLDYPSVGATENIIMAAVLAEGVTTIENAASEPEIVDLAQYLNGMGADIKGAGTLTIKIKGVKELNPVSYTPIPDRIEAGTLLAAAACAGGEVSLVNVTVEHLKPVISKLREMGASIEESLGGIKILSPGCEYLSPTDILTGPYPGFPTDLQPQFMALLCSVSGRSVISETVFENRFKHVPELNKLGCDIITKNRQAFITGAAGLSGASLKATDLRAGAALLIAGMIAKGETEIENVHHIDRGYCHLEHSLNCLGAEIARKSDETYSIAL